MAASPASLSPFGRRDMLGHGHPNPMRLGARLVRGCVKIGVLADAGQNSVLQFRDLPRYVVYHASVIITAYRSR